LLSPRGFQASSCVKKACHKRERKQRGHAFITNAGLFGYAYILYIEEAEKPRAGNEVETTCNLFGLKPHIPIERE
jgi:hypothetical protein